MRAWLAIAAVVGAVLLLDGKEPSAVPPKQPQPKRRQPENDLGKLAAPFRARVLELLERMRADGWHPLVWETYRSPERAAKLATDRLKGASMHTLGLAVDIVDAAALWSAEPGFWASLGKHARALGLTWGGDWETPDRPHVQAVPVGQQNTYRGVATLEGREDLLRRRWGTA